MIDARRNFSNLFACNNIFQEKFQNLFVNFYPYLGRNYPFYSNHSFYLSNINELINEEGYENVNKNYTDI